MVNARDLAHRGEEEEKWNTRQMLETVVDLHAERAAVVNYTFYYEGVWTARGWGVMFARETARVRLLDHKIW